MSTSYSRCLRSIAALLLIACAGVASAQPRGGRMMPPPRMPRPEIDVISVRSAIPDSSRVDVYFAVPYRLLDFLYVTEKYVADYGAIVQINDSATDRLVLDKYESFSVVEDPSQHDARTRHGIEMADAQQFSLNLRPGTYNVRLLIRDLSSHHEYDTTLTAHVRAYPTGLAALTDPIVYRQKVGQRILPAIGGDVGTVEPQSSGVFSLAYDIRDSGAWAVAVIRSENDEDDAELRSGRRISLKPGTPTQPVFIPIDFTGLWTGKYMLDIFLLPSSFDTAGATLEALGKNAIAQVTRPIHVSVLHGIPISQSDLDQAIEQLQIIATPSEWDSLDAARSSFEKRLAIIDFWRKRDPDTTLPGNRPMQVFYERIEHANAEFAYGGTAGWKTDRGRVYIMLGEPDYIDQHPYDANQKPYEIWEYSRIGTRFYFVDQYMLGEYRLASPPPAPGTFEWDSR